MLITCCYDFFPWLSVYFFRLNDRNQNGRQYFEKSRGSPTGGYCIFTDRCGFGIVPASCRLYTARRYTNRCPGWFGVTISGSIEWYLTPTGPCPTRIGFIISIDQRFNGFVLKAAIASTAKPWWRHQMETFSALLSICAGIHRYRSPVNSPHKGQWCGALVFYLICVWLNGWENNRKAGDLRRYRAHYDVIVMTGIVLRCCYLLKSLQLRAILGLLTMRQQNSCRHPTVNPPGSGVVSIKRYRFTIIWFIIGISI